MKSILLVTMSLAFSGTALASAPCSYQATVAAIKTAKNLGLSYVEANIEASIEDSVFTSKTATYKIITSFTSVEEHEFIRTIVKMDAKSCELLKLDIIQDSRR